MSGGAVVNVPDQSPAVGKRMVWIWALLFVCLAWGHYGAGRRGERRKNGGEGDWGVDFWAGMGRMGRLFI